MQQLVAKRLPSWSKDSGDSGVDGPQLVRSMW